MKEIQEAVRACLEERSGVGAVPDRCRSREYPMLAVSVREGGTVLLDGGRQAEHTYLVTVTAVSDRDREENTPLLSELIPLLLRGVPLEENGENQVLHPLDIRTEGGEADLFRGAVPPPPRGGRAARRNGPGADADAPCPDVIRPKQEVFYGFT